MNVALREALVERLDASLDRPLAVIVSPAGFGKTTLLAQWWRRLAVRPDIATAWLTVDPLDSEVSRFVTGAILAVAKSGVDLGALEVAARQQSIDADVRTLLGGFVAALRACTRRVVLVLDDYHRAQSPAVDGVVAALIEHAQDRLHVVVSGRSKPTFQVSAMAARGMVSMLDARDLAMSREEAAAIVGPDVSDGELAILHARTEGWAVALQLARIWMERGARHPESLREFSGRSNEMTDYLAEQIVQDLPVELREFLLEASLLERFSAPLIDAVRERSDSAELLERLSALNALIVPVDSDREWFRFHQLFADFLAQRLHRSPPGRVAALHRRAARFLAAAGDLLEAAKHALKAGDGGLAVEIIQRAGGWELILWRGIPYVRTLLKCFTDVAIRSEPVLQMMQSYLHLKLGQYDAAGEMLALTEASASAGASDVHRDYLIVASLRRVYVDDVDDVQLLDEFQRRVDDLPKSDHLGRASLLSAVAVTAIETARVEQVEMASRAAIREMRAAGSVLGTNYCFLHLAQSHALRGRLREAESLFREAHVMAEDNFGADSALKCLSGVFLARSFYVRNDRDAAQAMLWPSLDSIEAGDGWLDVFATAYELAVRLAYAEHGIEGAVRQLARASAAARDRRLRRLADLVAAWRVEHLALAGHLREARNEARVANTAAIAERRGGLGVAWRVRAAAVTASARLALASGSATQALTMLEAMSEELRGASLVWPANRLDAVAILALKQRGDEAEALAKLEPLLEYVLAEGGSRLLLDQGAGLESLLVAAQRRSRELVLSGAQRDLIGRLLVELERDHPRDRDGFSSREIEVLRELIHGRSNKAIGQLLDLSENTVKFHLKRLFKKLGVETRSGAIATAIARGLIEAPDEKPRPDVDPLR